MPVFLENVIEADFRWKFGHLKWKLMHEYENKWINAWTWGCLGLRLFECLKLFFFPPPPPPQRWRTQRHLRDSGSGGFRQREQDRAQERGGDHVCLRWGRKETGGTAGNISYVSVSLTSSRRADNSHPTHSIPFYHLPGFNISIFFSL